MPALNVPHKLCPPPSPVSRKVSKEVLFSPLSHCPLSAASERNRLKKPTEGSNTNSSSLGPPDWKYTTSYYLAN